MRGKHETRLKVRRRHGLELCEPGQRWRKSGPGFKPLHTVTLGQIMHCFILLYFMCSHSQGAEGISAMNTQLST